MKRERNAQDRKGGLIHWLQGMRSRGRMIKQAVAEVLTPEMRSQEGASRSNAANSRWSERILTLMADDVRSAENVLRQHGFTRQQALSFVKKSTLGAIQYQPNIPSILKDPTQAPYAALQMLLLAEHIESADPYSVQIGRIWGVTDMGMRFPDIARKVIEWNMGVISGPGGRRDVSGNVKLTPLGN